MKIPHNGLGNQTKKYYAKRIITFFCILSSVVLNVNCNEYYLQNASVLSNRKMPTITTSLGDYRIIDIEVSGGYSGKKPAEYTQGTHTDYVSSNGRFDCDCASDTNRNDSTNNVPYSGDNITLQPTQWNATLQLSFVPFYKKTELKVYRLRILGEAQYGNSENSEYLNFKFGPTFSSIGRRFAIHPKILLGYSKIEAKYQALIRSENEQFLLLNDSSCTYTWVPDSGEINSYRFYTEFGATFEFPFNKTFSLLTDLSGTYQFLFEYPSGKYIYLAYAEFSPAIKISASKYLTILSGISIPYNRDMNEQYPIQGFVKAHLSIGPYW